VNIHEYQAKELLRKEGVPIPPGEVARSAADAEAIARKFGGTVVVKAQVHAGGRGKAGGVKLVDSADAAAAFAKQWLGKRLVTIQTDASGQPVSKVYVESATDIGRELYLGAVIDRASRRIVFMASTEGGVEIEKVAHETPEKIIRAAIDPFVGAQPFQGRELAFALGLKGDQVRDFAQLFVNLVRLFVELDCSLVEVNPLVVTKAGKIHCLDAKVNIDGNALFRQKRIAAMRDESQEDAREVEASKFNLNYVTLEGNIGCMVNGAGLAMGTMDLIKHHGGSPANFLDVGGGATKEAVAEAFKIILSDKNVKAVLINIFGGIASCVTIADGIIGAVKEVGVKVPVVVRFEGNNSISGAARLKESGLNIITANGLKDAAEKVVNAAGGKR